MMNSTYAELDPVGQIKNAPESVHSGAFGESKKFLISRYSADT